MTDNTITPSRNLAALVFGCALGICLFFVFWPTLEELQRRWGESQYSHGYLVPLFSLYLLWSRRVMMTSESLRPTWWGLTLLGAGLALRFAGTFLYFDWFSAASLIPCLAGLTLLVGGVRALHWAWPALAFLVFMVPLPYRLEIGLAHPLQRVATIVSTFVIQTLGFVAFAEGNVIRLGETRIGVVEACSGLSMLLNFFALSTAVVLLTSRPPLEKAFLFLSAIPVALIANITRIVVTAILYKTAGHELADYVFHDLAGWLMMPLALFLLWAEICVLSWVLVPEPTEEPEAVDLPGFAFSGSK